MTIHEMYTEIYHSRSQIKRLTVELDTTKAERDDARLIYCEFQFLFNNPNKQMNLHKLTALEKGWDCYKDTL